MRHELMSVALVADREDLEARAHDWELVLHLVASHHGWCRPFPPAVADPPPGEDVELAVDLDGEPVQLRRSSAHDLARLDGGIAERFAQLQRRYGWWGLAWLEALLRLADHRASEHQDSVHPKENP
ncbi:MAG TPA: hypothetical protein ENK18_18590 [Deltaproteobacteria bacterium]|nr:hypothetical protein [Deltaproteobacteria bacterium]